jgi:dCMP deaminase
MSHDQIFINIANELKQFSRCQYTKVACIAVNEDGRIKATGVNGTAPGMENCCDHHFEHREDHKEWSDDYEIHAEMNLIEDLARSGQCPSHMTIYTTLSPCKNCLKHLIGLVKRSGVNHVTIDKIVYGEKYHRLTDSDIINMKAYCMKANIKLVQIGEDTK